MSGKEAMKPGLAFESTVAEVQRMFGDDCSVTHNELIVDRNGHKRQFDVVLRGQMAGHELLGVLECKDHKRALPARDVEAFVTKSAAVRANLRAIVTRMGYTRTALDLCRHHGILALTLLKQDEKDRGLTVGAYAYLRRYDWDVERVRWGAISEAGLEIAVTSPVGATVGGTELVPWLLHELNTTYLQTRETGWHLFAVVFDEAAMLTSVDGVNTRVVEVGFEVQRTRRIFRQPMFWSGTGLVDMVRQTLKTPKGSRTEARLSMRPGLAGWEEVPEAPDGFEPLAPVGVDFFAFVRSAPEEPPPGLSPAVVHHRPPGGSSGQDDTDGSVSSE